MCVEDQEEDVNEFEEGFYLQRLDAGLYTLQMTDLVLAFVTVNLRDKGVKRCC